MTTTEPTRPAAWANLLSTLWGPRFPVDICQIALEWSKKYDDPITKIIPADVPTFEGALFPLEKKRGWAILYNPRITSRGRINYTLGHEFGHFLVHRTQVPEGFECSERDLVGTADRVREKEADQFASYLLMPLTDFRTQLADQAMSHDLLRHLADRYDVSFTAAALKWIECTPLCAVVVVATNGFVLWGRRSSSAHRAGIYIPSRQPLPPSSLAARGGSISTSEELPAGVWARYPVREISIFADRYEMTISLLVFDASAPIDSSWDEEPVEDAFDRFNQHSR